MNNKMLVTSLDKCRCSFGSTSCGINTSSESIQLNNAAIAVITDVNELCFGTCSSPQMIPAEKDTDEDSDESQDPVLDDENAANNAASQDCTPPCQADLDSTWSSENQLSIDGSTLLDSNAILNCSYGGVISIQITNPIFLID